MDKLVKCLDKDGNVVEAELKLFKELDCYYRIGTSDRSMLNDCIKNYSCIPISDKDIVVDMGANIGGFSAMALRAGARVHAYEPDEYNFEMLDMNCKGKSGEHSFIGHKVAVISDESPYVIFGSTKSRNSACAGKVLSDKESEYSRYEKVKVPAISFNEISKLNPTILKIDIEGGEYSIFDSHDIPQSVNYLALELHGMTVDTYPKMLSVFSSIADSWDIVYYVPEILFNNLRMINVIFKRNPTSKNEVIVINNWVPNPNVNRLCKEDDTSIDGVIAHSGEYL